MKRFMGFICVMVVTIASVGVANAERTMYAGVKGGVNIASVGGSDAGNNTSSLTGIEGGAFFGIDFTPQFGGRIEGLYVQKGAQVDSAGVSGKQKLGYIEFPVVFVANLASSDKGAFSVFAGPTFGFLASAKAESGSLSVDDKSLFKSFEFGATVGVGAAYKLSSLSIVGDVRYTLGATSVAKDEGNQSVDLKTRGIGIMVGVSFPIGG
jgi:Outer membrane protein beta-barrel domain